MVAFYVTKLGVVCYMVKISKHPELEKLYRLNVSFVSFNDDIS